MYGIFKVTFDNTRADWTLVQEIDPDDMHDYVMSLNPQEFHYFERELHEGGQGINSQSAKPDFPVPYDFERYHYALNNEFYQTSDLESFKDNIYPQWYMLPDYQTVVPLFITMNHKTLPKNPEWIKEFSF